jgi:NADH-quinone oxidoreductase subunit J
MSALGTTGLLLATELVDPAVPGGPAPGLGEAVAFWVLGPVALAGALGTVFARNAVHSALCLAGTMLTLGFLYLAQGALFLGFVQIIVYTGAVMMLFLFVLMLVGRDSSDSVVEVLRGQRSAALLFGVGLAVLLVGTVGRAFSDVVPVGLNAGGQNWNGNVPGLGRLIFTRYLFAFELTSALLITAALGAMVLAYAQTGAHGKRGQRAMVEARLRGEHDRISPLPGPGVYATANSVAVPAVLPDGSVAPESLAQIIDRTEVRPAPEPAPDDAHALTGRRAPAPANGAAHGDDPAPADGTAHGDDPLTANGAASVGGSSKRVGR